LDRRAWQCLFGEMGAPADLESAFDAKSIWAALRGRPDVMVVDADDVNGKGIDSVQMILRLTSDTRILVLSRACDAGAVHAWSECDIDGYVVKDDGVEVLSAAVDALRHGRRYFSESVRGLLASARRAARQAPALTPRESELLPLLARGLKLRDAAAAMSVTYKTADSHRTRLMKKIGVSSRVELARYAIRHNIIDA
jgi:DNA-binding NarL/FixJ family response regulator